MLLFRSITPAPLELLLCLSRLVLGIHMVFRVDPPFQDGRHEDVFIVVQFFLETAHLHLPVGQHLLLLL